MTWQDRAACKSHPELDWFPTQDHPGGQTREQRSNVAACKAVCASCPVIGECLHDAETHWAVAGIWGGTTESERKRPDPRPEPVNHPTCGTDRGYHRHRRAGEPSCASCLHAHSRYSLGRQQLREKSTRTGGSPQAPRGEVA